VASAPCSAGGGDRAFDPDASHEGDLDGLRDLSDRFGYRTYEGNAAQIFTKPDSVTRAYKKNKNRKK
jgi:hypothetical protein